MSNADSQVKEGYIRMFLKYLEKKLRKMGPAFGLLAAGLLATTIFAIACGPSAPADQPAATSAPASQSSPTQVPASNQGSGGNQTSTSGIASLRGDIAIDGSSTVFPITEAVAEEFGKLTSGNVRVTVGISGTGGGFKKFCNGETQITDASRPIKESEVELCQQAGIEYIEIPVAIDGLTVMVNSDNDFVECMTVDELHTIWSPEAEGSVTRWSQVRPGWPDETIRLYAPGVDSGTFDYFTETVNGESQASRGDFTASEDDNVLVQGIAGDRYSLGYFGYAYYAENAGKLKAIAIDGGEGCVEPTDQTINNGSYAPLSRPLFIYVRKDAADTPHIRSFVEYYLSEEGGQSLASEVGYIPFPAEVYGLALDRFQEGATGTLFGGANPKKGPVADVLSAG